VDDLGARLPLSWWLDNSNSLNICGQRKFLAIMKPTKTINLPGSDILLHVE
jgi:hypothetical protein